MTTNPFSVPIFRDSIPYFHTVRNAESGNEATCTQRSANLPQMWYKPDIVHREIFAEN